MIKHNLDVKLQPSNYLYDPNLNLYISVSTIFPHEAEKILASQVKNRPVSSVTVRKYVEMMKEGAWVLNGESIIFANGKLIDGQHRLNAVIQSKTPLTVILVEIGDEFAFRTLDQGKKRNNSDVLSIAGFKSTNLLAAALSMLQKVDRDGQLIGNGAGARVNIPNYEIEKVAKKYPGLENSILKADKWHKMLKVRKSSLIVLHYLLRREGEGTHEDIDCENSKVDKFMDQVFHGFELSKGSPALVLRNAFISGLSEGVIMEPAYILKAGIICWNNWIKSKSMKLLRIERAGRIPKPKRP